MLITGVILAGGKGRRMGGLNKGLLSFSGKPMVEHVLNRFKPQVAEMLINANADTSQYAAYGYAVIADAMDDAGPLAGIQQAMKVAQHEYVLSVPCDSPMLSHQLADRLMNALVARDADVAVAKTGQQTHPVFCLCRKSLLPHLTAYLQQGGRKVETWFAELEVVQVSFDDQAQAFANINTHETLSQLSEMAAAHSQ